MIASYSIRPFYRNVCMLGTFCLLIEVFRIKLSSFKSQRNVDDALRIDIMRSLGVQEGVVNGKYLGLLYVISKNNKFTFRYIRDRLWRSLQCWKCIPLASAGGEVLIKAIAQAIPNYCMRIYLFPHSLAKELQKMINSFDPKIGNNPSYTWRSICNSQVLLKENFRWKIGDSSTINIWNEPWVRSDDGPHTLTNIIPGYEHLIVKDLIHEGERPGTKI
ncbi:hypothetical protein HKD37_05G012549 [Glycine soja]